MDTTHFWVWTLFGWKVRFLKATPFLWLKKGITNWPLKTQVEFFSSSILSPKVPCPDLMHTQWAELRSSSSSSRVTMSHDHRPKISQCCHHSAHTLNTQNHACSMVWLHHCWVGRNSLISALYCLWWQRLESNQKCLITFKDMCSYVSSLRISPENRILDKSRQENQSEVETYFYGVQDTVHYVSVVENETLVPSKLTFKRGLSELTYFH